MTTDERSTEILAEQLRQLIDALDRRVPHVDRCGEVEIARDARALKEKAIARLAALREGR